MWEIGDCFRCDRESLLVSRIGVLTGDGHDTTIYACRRCAIRLTAMHDRPPVPFVPLYITTTPQSASAAAMTPRHAAVEAHHQNGRRP